MCGMVSTPLHPDWIGETVEKTGRPFITLLQLAARLPAGRRSALGLTKSPTLAQILAACEPFPAPWRIKRKGNGAYLLAWPLDEVLAWQIRKSPGRTLGQIAQHLPLTKSEATREVNLLLAAGRLRVQVSWKEREPKIHLWSGPETETKPAGPLVSVSSIRDPESRVPDQPRDQLRAFRAATDSVGRGRELVDIFPIRRHLGWPRTTFDRFLEKLRLDGYVVTYTGNPGDLTEDEVRDSYEGPDRELYITLVWRRTP